MNDTQKQKVISQLNGRKCQGLSLIEVALVIAIMALIVGGILVGNDLIAEAKLRKQVTQLATIESGIQGFQTKYNCYPGDCADPSVISGYTYSGNGNGFLENTWNDDENKGFWLHLNLSRMILDTLVSHTVLADMKIPQTKVNTNGVINAYGDLQYAQNVLEVDTMLGTSGAFKTLEIRSIDNKMDDGKASSGLIRSIGRGDGTTSIYTSPPVFPLSNSTHSGSNQCISGGDYSSAAATGDCNMLYILSAN
jgi:type II secretory pathway pseudopilin PulG